MAAIWRNARRLVAKTVAEHTEQDGSPTCPFTPSVTKKLYPYSDGVLRRENSFILSICQPLPARSLRVRLQADNTHGAVEPAVSKTITLTPQSGEN